MRRQITGSRLDWNKPRISSAAGSFTHAGETLGLSQSAVSRQASAFEQDWKLRIFIAMRAGLVRTGQGELLVRMARRRRRHRRAALHGRGSALPKFVECDNLRLDRIVI